MNAKFCLWGCGLLALLAAGCDTEAYCYECDSQSQQDSGVNADGGGGNTNQDTGPDGVIQLPDTGIPDGDAQQEQGQCTADTMTDPLNCGECGNVCVIANAYPRCDQGICQIDECSTGFHNADQNDENGCEYPCTPSENAAELCNYKDDNCNGELDEGFDLESDPLNCGSCGFVCTLEHATAACEIVDGSPRCTIDACDEGYSDADQFDVDGCEYACPVNPPVDELCNELDDDCDGVINNGNPGGGDSCEEPCQGPCQGACTAGTTICAGTTIVCSGGTGPSLEVCDDIDNDCDGDVDNGFSKDTDPLNCGSCGTICNLQNAVGGCVQGGCQIAACLPGYASVDGDPNNGCEYACPVTPSSTESCNNLDDDCDGTVDNPEAIAAQKPPSDLCNSRPGTPCENADFVCQGSQGWRCSYGTGAELSPEGSLLLTETKCDGMDGNCNGQIDEVFADLNTECDNGELGACRDAGKRVCDPADDSRTLCDLSLPPDAISDDPTMETCNGSDDDCDGTTDEDIVDDMVEVQASGLHFFIDRYEASRPDATDSSPGIMETRTCTMPGRIPWTQAPHAEAILACAATGRRLCSFEEYMAACASAAGNVFPYGVDYNPSSCNGNDFANVPGGGNNTILLPTGAASIAACISADGVHDLSGNASEWTSNDVGDTGAPLNLDIYLLHGGSYLSPPEGLTCSFSISRASANAIHPSIGFRCCRNL